MRGNNTKISKKKSLAEIMLLMTTAKNTPISSKKGIYISGGRRNPKISNRRGAFFWLTNIQGCNLGCRQNFLSNTKEYIFKLLQKIVNKLHSIYVKNI